MLGWASLRPSPADSDGALLQRLNDAAAALFESGNGKEVDEGVSVLNELVIPCMHLIMNNHVSRDDLDAIEVMRNRWCAYLGKDVGGKKSVLGTMPTFFYLL